ncbi:MAG: sulfite exporter TauE/SafE family protein, partial [Candidatus Saccharimonadales bacterium]
MLKDILLLGTGFIVGAMNAIAGGGMLLGFPVLLAIGMPALTANATTYLIVLPGNLAAAIGYRKYLQRVPRHYLLLLIPTVLGGALGTYFLRHTAPGDFAKIVPLLIVFAVALFAYQPFLYKY